MMDISHMPFVSDVPDGQLDVCDSVTSKRERVGGFRASVHYRSPAWFNAAKQQARNYTQQKGNMA